MLAHTTLSGTRRSVAQPPPDANKACVMQKPTSADVFSQCCMNPEANLTEAAKALQKEINGFFEWDSDNSVLYMHIPGQACKIQVISIGNSFFGHHCNRLIPDNMTAGLDSPFGPKDAVTFTPGVLERGRYLHSANFGKWISLMQGTISKMQGTYPSTRFLKTPYDSLELALEELVRISVGEHRNLCAGNGELLLRLSSKTAQPFKTEPGRFNTADSMRKNVRERMAAFLMIAKTIYIPRGTDMRMHPLGKGNVAAKKTGSYASFPVCLMLFDLGTLKYAGLATAETLYKHISMDQFPCLHKQAMLLFPLSDEEEGYAAMSQDSLDVLLDAIDRLPESVIDGSGKRLITLMAQNPGNNEPAEEYLASYPREQKLAQFMLASAAAVAVVDSIPAAAEERRCLLPFLPPDIARTIGIMARDQPQPVVHRFQSSYSCSPWRDPY